MASNATPDQMHLTFNHNMNRPPSLCPGYKHVDSFGSDEEYESEEEVCYVTLDLGDVEPKLVPSSNSYRLIGLDTPTSFLQIQGTVLQGRHDALLGTELIFTDDKDVHDGNKRSVVHVANTEQRIAFHEVTLIPKASANAKGKDKATGPDDMDQGGDGEPTQTPASVQFQTPPADDTSATIDRMTGLIAPPTRAPRRKKQDDASGSAKPAKRKGKEKRTDDDSPPKPTKSAKAKGKQREIFPPMPSPPRPAIDEDAIGVDDIGDMYMDME